MSAGSDLGRLSEWVVSIGVAFLPERWKQEGRLAAFASPSAHVASGMLEIVASVGLFIVGMIRYVTAFSGGPGTTYLVHQPSLGYGDFFGMGALGFVSYLIRPTSLLLLYLFGEGIIRALEAAIWERMVGTALISVPWRLALRLRRAGERADLAALLGPPRPDEIVPPEASRSGLFEVYSVEHKPWGEYQVVEHDGRFFVLATRQLVRRGRHHAFRYQFHPLEEREVIRGAIVDLTPAAAPPPPPPEAGTPG